MANVERLTKRVKEMEEWIGENGSGPTLDNFNYLLDMLRQASGQAMEMQRNFNTQRQLLGDYLQAKELIEDWDSWLKEKDNAEQEKQTEEESVQKEE
jgi:chemotaxis regulatin CheY-phosphate phosphatase CheZ